MRYNKEKVMLERRDTKRVEVNAPITLSVEDFEVRSQMINYSEHGALFKIHPEDREKVYTDDLGKEAIFVLKIKDQPDREYTGEIIRFFFQGEDKYIALRFWDAYRELQ
jgi:hypothetical protein